METGQTVLTGLILAFIMRAFLVEPFIIPTGSMATSLLGAHATRVCPACGWEYDFAPLQTASPTGSGFVCPPEVICPNCHLWLSVSPAETVPLAGDRILVHKWPYALGGPLRPERWDVIVFRDPANPRQHYIKRVVGLPNETIEILDGDVFIDGRIERKPPHVQQVLWSVVFDQAHLATTEATSGRLPRWRAVGLADDGGNGWSGLDARVMRYDGLDDEPRKIAFNPDTDREYLLDLYAYNRRSSRTFVGDVRIVSEVTLEAGDGWCRWEIERPPYIFLATMQRDGAVRLHMQRLDGDGDGEVALGSRAGRPFPLGRPVAVEFGHVDHRVYLTIDGRELLSTTDADYSPRLDVLRAGPGQRPVGLHLAAQNLRLEVHRLRIDRDVHYTADPQSTRRASPGRPFELRSGEYFVLGDNSPDSHDSREWTEAGPHLPPDYRPGTVPADQIVGQAAFVYLPALLPLDSAGRWHVPDIGRVRFVR